MKANRRRNPGFETLICIVKLLNTLRRSVFCQYIYSSFINSEKQRKHRLLRLYNPATSNTIQD